jgi:hypothetical protein
VVISAWEMAATEREVTNLKVTRWVRLEIRDARVMVDNEWEDVVSYG